MQTHTMIIGEINPANTAQNIPICSNTQQELKLHINTRPVIQTIIKWVWNNVNKLGDKVYS